MSNGHRCCALRVCCPDSEANRIAALATIIREDAEHTITPQAAQDAAKVVLQTFDLVPLGVGEAIVNGYKEIFAEAAG